MNLELISFVGSYCNSKKNLLLQYRTSPVQKLATTTWQESFAPKSDPKSAQFLTHVVRATEIEPAFAVSTLRIFPTHRRSVAIRRAILSTMVLLLAVSDR